MPFWKSCVLFGFVLSGKALQLLRMTNPFSFVGSSVGQEARLGPSVIAVPAGRGKPLSSVARSTIGSPKGLFSSTPWLLPEILMRPEPRTIVSVNRTGSSPAVVALIVTGSRTGSTTS